MTMMLPDYRYRFMKDNIVENEICPVIAGISSEAPKPNPNEVQAIRWLSWQDWLSEIEKHPAYYSPWCVEETQLLSQKKAFLRFLQLNFQ
jgi:isopentenyl-diphosphate delta-isomerase